MYLVLNRVSHAEHGRQLGKNKRRNIKPNASVQTAVNISQTAHVKVTISGREI